MGEILEKICMLFMTEKYQMNTCMVPPMHLINKELGMFEETRITIQTVSLEMASIVIDYDPRC